MASDFQVKREHFGSLITQIKTENMEFFRGKTLSRIFIIGKSSDDMPALLFPGNNNNVPVDIKEKLTKAFDSVFGE
jgi:hypothetical protein